jgi:TrpR-related protein YerC/YecD
MTKQAEREGNAVAQAQAQVPDGKDLLARALLSLKTTEEVDALLCDLCTPREMEDLAQRLQVAYLLDSGSSYVTIQEATGASATTVARVARCLKYGPGGYSTVLGRI